MSSQLQYDKHHIDKNQLVIAEILKDDENKYCADCDAKGPRWASWNLGVLLCIRCAGIHRGLGVHISKVKSLNLDSWEPQQISMLRTVGNRRGRQLYEANLPEYFRRPQTDSAVEQFIRAKYDQKRYVSKDFVLPKADLDSFKKELNRLEHAHKKRSTVSKPLNLQDNVNHSQGRTLKSIAKSTSNTADIFSLGSANQTPSISKSTPSSSPASTKGVQMAEDVQENVAQLIPASESSQPIAPSFDLLGLEFGSPSSGVAQQNGVPGILPTSASSSPSASAPVCSSKESILALYALSNPPQSNVSTFQNNSQQQQQPLVNGKTTTSSLMDILSSSSQGPSQAPPRYFQVAPSPAPVVTGLASKKFDWTSTSTSKSTEREPGDVFGAFSNLHSTSTFVKPAQSFATDWSSTPAPVDLHSSQQGQNQHHWNASAFNSANSVSTLQSSTAKPSFNAAIDTAQQSYLTQIQSQLAAMQVRESVSE